MYSSAQSVSQPSSLNGLRHKVALAADHVACAVFTGAQGAYVLVPYAPSQVSRRKCRFSNIEPLSTYNVA
eukprot:scaffold567939_cov18-Prasinocladus_malaysianus.AAC.1